ncbi:MAG: NAD(P)-dependent alcohol dehydrogenase [Mariprofundaceae bacterium]|nr:NAD(P)-dependent alcohol dehydrogenase [Mariprofundaceae bacterium]
MPTIVKEGKGDFLKAVLFSEYGSPDVLRLGELKKPKPKNIEVLVNVRAVSVNSWDWELLRGTPFANRLMFGFFRPTRIRALGCDIAGRIEAVGSRVRLFKPGDEVFGDLSNGGWGGFAEYTCAKESELSLKPTEMTFEQAAAIPQAGLLALQGLNYKGQVQAGQKVLINGGGGGAGTFAIQIAKSFGAEVTAVDSAEKLETMQQCGADHVVDYAQVDYVNSGEQYDRIFDCVARHSIFDYMRALTPGGVYAMIGGDSGGSIMQIMLLGPIISMFSNKKLGIVMHKANKGVDELIELFEAGHAVPAIERTYPLSDVPDALRYFDGRHVKGKIVITLEESS